MLHGGKPVFLFSNFFSQHCVKLAPILEDAVEVLSKAEPKRHIGKIDGG